MTDFFTKGINKTSFCLESLQILPSIKEKNLEENSEITEQANKDSFLLKMESNSYNGNSLMTWKINDSNTSFNLTSDFYHYKLIIDRKTNEIGLSIKSLSNENILDKHLIKKVLLQILIKLIVFL